MLATFAKSALLGCAVAVEFNFASFNTFNDHQVDNLINTLKDNPHLSNQLLEAMNGDHSYQNDGYHDHGHQDNHYDSKPIENYGFFGPVFYHEELSSDSDVHHQSSAHYSHHDSHHDDHHDSHAGHYSSLSLHDPYYDDDSYDYSD